MGFFDGPFLNTMGGMPTIPQAPKPTVPTMGASAMSEGAAFGKSITPPPAYSPPPTPAPVVSTPAPAFIPTPAPAVIPKPAPPVVMPQPAAPVATTSGANITSDENQGFTQASLGGMAQVQQPTPVQPTPSIQPPAPVAPTGGPGGGFGETTQPAKPATPVSPTQPPAPVAPTGGPGGGASETVGGTALTPATPSPMGGGSGALPTASVGGSPAVAGVTEKFDAIEPTGMGTEPQSLGLKSSTSPVNIGGAENQVEALTDVTQTQFDATGGNKSVLPQAEIAQATTPATTADPVVDMGDVSGVDPAGLKALADAGGIFGGKPIFGEDTDWSMTGSDLFGFKGVGATVSKPTAQTATGAGAGTGTGSLLDATSGADIASQFGFDPGEYGGYFTPISEAMKKAGTEEGYAGMLGEKRAQLRQQAGQSRQGLRASLLQDAMMAQQASGATGFAGGGAQEQALGLARAGRQLSADQLAAQYGRGMYGVRQQIAGRVAAGQQSLSQAQKAMYDRALQLQRSGAAMDYAGGPVAGTSPTLTNPGTPSSLLGLTQTDANITNDPSEITFDPSLIMPDPASQLTGNAYDDMIAQQQSQVLAPSLTNKPLQAAPKTVGPFGLTI